MWRVPTEIMWSDYGTGQFACLFHNKPCRYVSDRKYSIAGFDTFVQDIPLESISNPPRDEYDFSLFPALWSPQDQPLIDNIFQGQPQDLSDSHATPGHQFQNEPVPHFGCPKDNFIYDLLFYNAPVVRPSRPIQFPEHRRIAEILEGRVKIGPDEIEEGFKWEYRPCLVCCLPP